MEISEIITKVRLRIDEESQNEASIAAMAGDNTRMDNIITSLASDALNWLYLNAPTNLLCSDSESRSRSMYEELGITVENGKIELPDRFLRLVRVRGSDWHRAIAIPISEDSEEYLQLNNTDGATASVDRPQAALIETMQKYIEVWPNTSATYDITCLLTPITSLPAYDFSRISTGHIVASSSYVWDDSNTHTILYSTELSSFVLMVVANDEITYYDSWTGGNNADKYQNESTSYLFHNTQDDKTYMWANGVLSEYSNTDNYAVPASLESAFIYYITFLLLSAYGDGRSTRMLEIAKLNLGGVQ